MKINTKDVPDEYKGIVKDDMNMSDIQLLGEVIMRQKIGDLKNKWHMFWHKRGK